jgi:hypothetical protein
MGGPAGTSLLSRLQHNGGQVVILDAPAEFAVTLDRWRAEGLPVSQRRTPGSRFVLAFVRSCADIERTAGSVVTSVGSDGILWFAYPRQSSQRYRSDIAREDSWAMLGRLGFEGVRQIAIDDDWTALRFRQVEPAGGPGRTASRPAARVVPRAPTP